MKTVIKFCLFILVSYSSPQILAAGPNDGGGGFGIPTPNGNLVLVDYIANPDLVPKTELEGDPSNSMLPNDNLTERKISVSELNAYNEALYRIQLWKNTFTVPLLALEKFLLDMKWTFTNETIMEPFERYYLPQGVSNEGIRPILYFDPCYGVSASISNYPLLTMNSQIGAIIHEGLRLIQLRQHNQGYFKLDTKMIQRLVALLVFKKPSELTVEDKKTFKDFLKMNYDSQINSLTQVQKIVCEQKEYQRNYTKICQLSGFKLLESKELGKFLSQISDDLVKKISIELRTHEGVPESVIETRELLHRIHTVTRNLVDTNVSASTLQYRNLFYCAPSGN